MKLLLKLPQLISSAGKQSENLDYVFPAGGELSAENRLFIMCDGLGPFRAENDVAKRVGTLFYEYFNQVNPPKQRVGQIYINDALRYTERRLWQYIKENPSMQGIGSSVMILYINTDDTISIAWVGNIRAYHVRDKQIIYETEDHLTILRENGRNISVEPRVIFGTEPAWASVTIISDIQDNDYFMICTQGIYETFDHRNIKYLLSQGDGTDATNKAIVTKMQELCAQNWDDDFSVLLIPILKGTTASTTKVAEQVAAGGSATTSRTASFDNLPSGIIRKKERKTETINRKPLFSSGGNMNVPSPARAGIIMVLVLLAIGAAFAYKFYISKPEDVFKNYLSKAESSIAAGDYETAVALFEKALAVKLPDTTVFANVRMQLQEARYAWIEKQAEDQFNAQNWVRAKAKYEELLLLNPTDTLITQQIEVLQETIEAEKKKLIGKADTLLNLKDYVNAKQLLYEALYLDQENENILELINQCNEFLNLQSLSLTQALAIVNRMDSTGEFKSNRLAVVTAMRADTNSVLNNGDIFEQEPNPDNIYADPLPTSGTTSTTLLDKYNNLVKQGDDAMQAGNYENAKALYTEAIAYNRNSTIEAKINASEQAIIDKKYSNVIALADQAFENNNYESARNYYIEALKYKVNDEYAGNKADICRDKLAAASAPKTTQAKSDKNEKYDKVIGEANAAFASEDYATAKVKYREALQLSPVEASKINNKIAECDTKINELQSESSSKKMRRAEKICKSANYGEACYDFLKENNLLYGADAEILVKMSRYFETKDPAKSKECINIANNR